MGLLRKFRFSMSTAMILVLTAAVASALFAKAREHIPPGGVPYLRVDVPAVFIISIVLTAMGLGALKSHTPKQVMLQIILACLSFFGVVLLAEAGAVRPLLYSFQIGCALQGVAPLIARAYVKAEMERGPRRDWWKKTTEAVLFSFFTFVIVLVSSLLQWLLFEILTNASLLKFP